MTILFQSVQIKHERRVRLYFTHALDTGAFGAPGPAAYIITNLDGRGISPTVEAAMVIPSLAQAVEISLSDDLVKSALYSISAVGIPATDSSTTPSGSVLQIRYGTSTPAPNVEPGKADRELLLYGVDLLWNGTDYQEASNGDLERVSGTANVTKALYRGLESNGTPWDPSYGAHAREFVDSPSTASGTLKSAVQRQVLRDPRVATAKVTFSVEDGVTQLFIDPVLISGENVERVSMVVPAD